MTVPGKSVAGALIHSSKRPAISAAVKESGWPGDLRFEVLAEVPEAADWRSALSHPAYHRHSCHRVSSPLGPPAGDRFENAAAASARPNNRRSATNPRHASSMPIPDEVRFMTMESMDILQNRLPATGRPCDTSRSLILRVPEIVRGRAVVANPKALIGGKINRESQQLHVTVAEDEMHARGRAHCRNRRSNRLRPACRAWVGIPSWTQRLTSQSLPSRQVSLSAPSDSRVVHVGIEVFFSRKKHVALAVGDLADLAPLARHAVESDWI